MAFQPSYSTFADLAPNAQGGSSSMSSAYTPTQQDFQDLLPQAKPSYLDQVGQAALDFSKSPIGYFQKNIPGTKLTDFPSVIQGLFNSAQQGGNYIDRGINALAGTNLQAPGVNVADVIPQMNQPQSTTNPLGANPSAISLGNIAGNLVTGAAAGGLAGGLGEIASNVPTLSRAANAIANVPYAGKPLSYLSSLLPAFTGGAVAQGTSVANDPNSSIPQATIEGGLLGAGGQALLDTPIGARALLAKFVNGKGDQGAITPDEFQQNVANVPDGIKVPLGDVANSSKMKAAYGATQVVPGSAASTPYEQLNQYIRGNLSDVKSNLNASPVDPAAATPSIESILNSTLENLGDATKQSILTSEVENLRQSLPAGIEYPGANSSLSNLPDAMKNNYLQSELTNIKNKLNPDFNGPALDKQIYDEYNQSYQTSLENEKNAYGVFRDKAAEIDSLPENLPTTKISYQSKGLNTVPVTEQIPAENNLVNPDPINKYIAQVYKETGDPQLLSGVGDFLQKVGDENGYPLSNLTNLLDLRQAINKRYGMTLSPDQGYQRGILKGLKSSVDEAINPAMKNYPELSDLHQAALQSHKDTLPFEQVGFGRKPSVSPFKQRFDTNINTANVSNGILSEYLRPSQAADSARSLQHLLSNVSPATRSAISHNYLFGNDGSNVPKSALANFDKLGETQKKLIFGQDKNALENISKINKSDVPLESFKIDDETKAGILHQYLFRDDLVTNPQNVIARYDRLDPKVKQFLKGTDELPSKLDWLSSLNKTKPSFNFLQQNLPEDVRQSILSNYLFKDQEKLDPAKAISNYLKLKPAQRLLLAGNQKAMLDKLVALKKQFPEIFQVDYVPKTGHTGMRGGLATAQLVGLLHGNVAAAAAPTIGAQIVQRVLRSDFLKNQYLKSLKEQAARKAAKP